MRVLFDTNLLARAVQPNHPMHTTAVAAGQAIRLRGDQPCLVPQILYEFWVVCTRPSSENGLGLRVSDVAEDLLRLGPPLFKLLDDRAEIYSEWRRLVVSHEVKGKAAHDARLVAAMAVHGVEAVLTFNTSDFARYRDIVVLDPGALVGVA